MALASHTPLSTELSEFDEMLVAKNIATREACLKCKGFTAEQVSEILAGEDEELEAETSLKLAAAIVSTAEAGANDGDDDSFEDSDADDDQALRAYREARVAEVRAAQVRKAEGGMLVQVSKASWEAEVVAASVGRWVVVHLHADSSLESQTGRGVPQQCAAPHPVQRSRAGRGGAGRSGAERGGAALAVLGGQCGHVGLTLHLPPAAPSAAARPSTAAAPGLAQPRGARRPAGRAASQWLVHPRIRKVHRSG